MRGLSLACSRSCESTAKRVGAASGGGPADGRNDQRVGAERQPSNAGACVRVFACARPSVVLWFRCFLDRGRSAVLQQGVHGVQTVDSGHGGGALRMGSLRAHLHDCPKDIEGTIVLIRSRCIRRQMHRRRGLHVTRFTFVGALAHFAFCQFLSLFFRSAATTTMERC